MSNNPYLDALDAFHQELTDLEGMSREMLVDLAQLHEMRRANDLAEAQVDNGRRAAEVTEALLDLQRPNSISIGQSDSVFPAVTSDRPMSILEDDPEGSPVIVRAARRWAKAYARRNTPQGSTAEAALASSELLEAIRQEDER